MSSRTRAIQQQMSLHHDRSNRSPIKKERCKSNQTRKRSFLTTVLLEQRYFSLIASSVFGFAAPPATGAGAFCFLGFFGSLLLRD